MSQTFNFRSARRRFLPFLCLLLLSGLLLAGCRDAQPILFHSSMTINPDESGNRTITASADKSSLSSLFGSSMVSFQSFIQINCPELMEWSYQETGSSYELTFTIPFDNLEDYQEKIAALTQTDNTVSISRPQTGVRTGFTLTEDTDTLSLFSWLTDALIARSGNESLVSALLRDGENTLTYAGVDYPQNGKGLYVYVETLFDAEHIDILTGLAPDDTWNRSIRIHFPDEILDNASNVKPWLSSLLPEELSESWADDTTWVLDFPSCTLDALDTLMNRLFQASNAESLTETISSENPLRFLHSYQESLNVAFFVPNTGTTTVRYFILNSSYASLYLPGSDNESVKAVSLSNDYPDYTCLYSERMSEKTLAFSAVYQYQPQEITVSTQIISSQDIRRTTTLSFDCGLPNVHRSLMLDTFKKEAAGHGFVTAETSDSSYSVIYKQSGTDASINEGFGTLFGQPSGFSYSRGTSSLIDRKLESVCTDQINLASFLPEPQKTVLNYELQLPGNETLPDGTSVLTSVSSDGTISVSCTARRLNHLIIWFFLLDGIAAVFLIYLFIQGPFRSYVGRYRQQKRRSGSQKGGRKR